MWWVAPPTPVLFANCPLGVCRYECLATPLEKQILLDLHAATKPNGWIGKWDPNAQPCPCIHGWYGVSCDQYGHIEHLDLSFNNLRGALPKSLGGLPKLKTLKLHSNKLTGTLPPELANIPTLCTL